MNKQFVLSLFPGLGLLDKAFEIEGFTVVRGPDPIWGGDIREFEPPAYKFDGIIGGPPCQMFSCLSHLVPGLGYLAKVYDNLSYGGIAEPSQICPDMSRFKARKHFVLESSPEVSE